MSRWLQIWTGVSGSSLGAGAALNRAPHVSLWKTLVSVALSDQRKMGRGRPWQCHTCPNHPWQSGWRLWGCKCVKKNLMIVLLCGKLDAVWVNYLISDHSRTLQRQMEARGHQECLLPTEGGGDSPGVAQGCFIGCHGGNTQSRFSWAACWSVRSWLHISNLSNTAY